MSDVTLPSVPATTVQTVRRARKRARPRVKPGRINWPILPGHRGRGTRPGAGTGHPAEALRAAQGPRSEFARLVREYLTTLLSGQEREYFVVVALDNRHRVLASEILFSGTIDGARVYPREVVKCALRHNAAAVIFAHVHPSGVLEPSQADELITRHLKERWPWSTSGCSITSSSATGSARRSPSAGCSDDRRARGEGSAARRFFPASS